MEQEIKSLSEWRAEIKRIGKKHYLRLYQDFLGASVSNIPRFYKTLNLYGDWALFEAIVDSSEQNISGDPLNYVIAVARNKWKEMQKDQDEEDEYTKEIEGIKKISKEKNDELAKKLKKGKRK